MTVDTAEPLPVVVLTGFLGAGKTTLMNGLLRQPGMAGTAVIVNEFGEIGIDHLLVERVDGDMLMLTSGCLCCAARGDLVTALAGLVGRRRRGDLSFERIIIETTGLADPGPVLNALLPSEEVGGATCRLDRLVTVVDAVAGADTLAQADEARRQVAMADVLVLSKTDLREDRSQTPIEPLLRALNPTAPILAGADPALVLAAIRAPGPPPRSPSRHHHHSHLAGIDTVSLRAGRIDGRLLDRFLDRLVARHGADLLRLKGLVATTGAPDQPVLVNVVQHRIHPALALEGWPDADRGTRLVVILKRGLSREIGDLWDAFFGPPRIDRPDAAALARGFDAGPGLF